MLDVLPACRGKFRPRKVSAIRDFPKGCGPLALPVDVEPSKDVPPPAETRPDCVVVPPPEKASLDQKESLNALKTQKPEPLELRGSLERSQQHLIESSKGLDQIGVVDSSKATLVCDIKDEVKFFDPVIKLGAMEVSKESLDTPKLQNVAKDQEAAGGLTTKLYGPPRRRRVSAIRDFPPGCGRGAFPKEIASSSNSNLVGEKVWNGQSNTSIAHSARSVGTEEEVKRKLERSDPKQAQQQGVEEVSGELQVVSVSESNLNRSIPKEHTEKKLLAGMASRSIGEGGVQEFGRQVSNSAASRSNLKGNNLEDHSEKKVQARVASGVKLKCVDIKPVNKELQNRQTQEGTSARLDAKATHRSKDVEKETLNPVGKSVEAKLRNDVKSRKRKLFEELEDAGSAVNFLSLREESMSREVCANRLIVQALMAARRCPWGQGKRSRAASRCFAIA